MDNVLSFPIKTIIWGVYSETMNSFLKSGVGKSDVFNTWAKCNNFIFGVYGESGSIMQKIYPRPKRVLAYKEIDVSEV